LGILFRRSEANQIPIAVYPNPSDGHIVIARSGATKQSEVITAKVFDLLGRVVFQQQITFTDNRSSLNIAAPTGTYILELQDNEGNTNRQRITIR